MHYDMGIYHRVAKNIDARLAFYYTDISNYLVFDSPSSYYSGYYAYSLDSVNFYGVELEFNSTLFNKLGLFGNYTYRGMNRDETDLPVVFWLNLPPKHKFNIGLRYRLLKDTLLTCDLRYVGERKAQGGFSMNDFLTTDLGIEQTLFKKAKILFYANNLFGENYEEVYGYPMPDQTHGVQVKLTFF